MDVEKTPMNGDVLFTLPERFEPATVLPAGLLKHADDARWLISTVLGKTARGQVDDWGYVRLDSQILRRVMSQRHYSGIVQSLVNGQVVRTAGYSVGRKCKGYRLTDAMMDARCIGVPARDNRLVARIRRERTRMREDQERRWLPIHHDLNAMQRDLTIDDSADAAIARLTLNPHKRRRRPKYGYDPAAALAQARLCQSLIVADIRDRRFPFVVSGTWRVFNAITGMNCELRRLLRLHGEPISGVDIRCAQPALLGLLMHLHAGKNVATYMESLDWSGLPSLPLVPSPFPAPSADSSEFHRLAVSGSLYEGLLGECRRHGVDPPGSDADARAWVKLALLRDVLAKRGRYPSLVEDVFKSMFPSVYAFIQAFNHRDHAALIRSLQRVESWLVVETVCPKLVTGGIPVISLHDAIYSRQRDVEAVENAFRTTSGQIGFFLSLKVEQ